MSKYFLRLFSIDTLIDVVITYLASTVKNPMSTKAMQLRAVVTRLYFAARQFLLLTGGLAE